MRICCTGEVMVELAGEEQPGLYRQGVAGDSFNTAVYMARAELQVDYMTHLGDELFSAAIVRQLQAEGIGDRLIKQCPGRQPGLYLISNDHRGERQFTYWREQSPAREMFDRPVTLNGYDLFYFTGITLAVVRSGLDNLITLLAQLRRQGCTVAFDPNFRPQLWRDREQARSCYQKVLPWCDILLPTLEDETVLWGAGTVQACHALYQVHGYRELIIKGHDLVTHVFSAEGHTRRQARAVTATDTTGAGDAFNAGYLNARLNKQSIEEAIRAAQQLSAAVVQHRGAILPRGDTVTNRKQ